MVEISIFSKLLRFTRFTFFLGITEKMVLYDSWHILINFFIIKFELFGLGILVNLLSEIMIQKTNIIVLMSQIKMRTNLFCTTYHFPPLHIVDRMRPKNAYEPKVLQGKITAVVCTYWNQLAEGGGAWSPQR